MCCLCADAPDETLEELGIRRMTTTGLGLLSSDDAAAAVADMPSVSAVRFGLVKEEEEEVGIVEVDVVATV